nr:PREDICTED: uncharacterized protein LOC109039257 [Bemisia tabaci]
MTLKVVICVAALLIDLQGTWSDEASSAAKIGSMQSNIKGLLQKADKEIEEEVRDIMSRILFIRDQEVAEKKTKLATDMKPVTESLRELLERTRADEPENGCLAEFDPNYAQAVTNAGYEHFRGCVANYPPGGSVNMDITELRQSFRDLERNTSDALNDCKQGPEVHAEICLESLNEAFRADLARLKESRMTHMKSEAAEAEILERVKMEECMKEALTNARVMKDTFKDVIHNCVTQPRQIDPRINLALPRE